MKTDPLWGLRHNHFMAIMAINYILTIRQTRRSTILREVIAAAALPASAAGAILPGAVSVQTPRSRRFEAQRGLGALFEGLSKQPKPLRWSQQPTPARRRGHGDSRYNGNAVGVRGHRQQRAQKLPR